MSASSGPPGLACGGHARVVGDGGNRWSSLGSKIRLPRLVTLAAGPSFLADGFQGSAVPDFRRGVHKEVAGIRCYFSLRFYFFIFLCVFCSSGPFGMFISLLMSFIAIILCAFLFLTATGFCSNYEMSFSFFIYNHPYNYILWFLNVIVSITIIFVIAVDISTVITTLLSRIAAVITCKEGPRN